LYALPDRDDADHRACRRLIEGSDESLVIPAPGVVKAVRADLLRAF
jgi:hypothetical protein